MIDEGGRHLLESYILTKKEKGYGGDGNPRGNLIYKWAK